MGQNGTKQGKTGRRGEKRGEAGQAVIGPRGGGTAATLRRQRSYWRFHIACISFETFILRVGRDVRVACLEECYWITLKLRRIAISVTCAAPATRSFLDLSPKITNLISIPNNIAYRTAIFIGKPIKYIQLTLSARDRVFSLAAAPVGPPLKLGSPHGMRAACLAPFVKRAFAYFAILNFLFHLLRMSTAL